MNLQTSANAFLVESIPKGLEDLRGTPGVQYTEDVLVRLTQAAQSTIDLTAMYWSLLPDQSADEAGFTGKQLEVMGAGTGRALLNALRCAAARGVRIRILESPGFSDTDNPESAALRDEFPSAVFIHQVAMEDWYGGSGMMHQKIWIFDGRSLYLGSANMDWKSITQVKEIGIAVEDCPALATDATKYFEAWLVFSGLTASSVDVFDPDVRVTRGVPPWSCLVPAEKRACSPLDDEKFRTTNNLHAPLALEFDGVPGGVFLTGCPREVRNLGRSYDGEGLVHTIDDARRSVSISVMDFAPVGIYARNGQGDSAFEDGAQVPMSTPVWWPSLVDALLSAALTRKVWVRLLVSKWAHSSSVIEPFLRSLQLAADAGRANKYMSAGQIEIKQFIIPGWDETAGPHRRYPGHSRVNHTKFIVTDRRLNIGTSNMTWDYFASTAGSSFNTDHPGLVKTLQSVFDRDWASPYAYSLR
jgi:phospholipase D3/4